MKELDLSHQDGEDPVRMTLIMVFVAIGSFLFPLINFVANFIFYTLELEYCNSNPISTIRCLVVFSIISNLNYSKS